MNKRLLVRTERQIIPSASLSQPNERQKTAPTITQATPHPARPVQNDTAPVIPERKRAASAIKESNFTIRRTTARKEWTKTVTAGCQTKERGRNHEVKTPFLCLFRRVRDDVLLLLLVVIVFSDEEDGGSGGNLIYGGVNVSQEVLAHKPMLEKYAREYGIEEYLNVLLAIIQVESGGTLEDVMQSSESLGLPPNSLSTEESIKQGCKYFSELLVAAETKGCDLNSVIQSYNYGGGFLDYVAGRGKKYTFELAESFARDKSSGKKVTYTNPVAVEKNGGWRYSYGNMFYVLLVSQYLTVAQFDDETVQAIMEEALKYEGWTYVYGGRFSLHFL